MEAFQRKMIFISEYTKEHPTLVASLSDSIDRFAERYEDYIRSYAPQAVMPLMIQARSLYNLLEGFFISIKLSSIHLENKHMDDNGQVFSIYLPDSISLADFANKLQAIHNLYESIALILKINTVDIPLRLEKVESGSLWSKVFGDSRIVGLIVDFLRSSARYMYRNYTKEGKIGSVPHKLDSLNELLNFTKRLEQEGVETAEINDILRASAVKIAKDINVLIGDQRSMEINGEKISIGSELEKDLIERNTKAKIEFDKGNNGGLPNLKDDE